MKSSRFNNFGGVSPFPILFLVLVFYAYIRKLFAQHTKLACVCAFFFFHSVWICWIASILANRLSKTRCLFGIKKKRFTKCCLIYMCFYSCFCFDFSSSSPHIEISTIISYASTFHNAKAFENIRLNKIV